MAHAGGDSSCGLIHGSVGCYQFLIDLADIEAIALWAEEQGVKRMTLEVNW